MSPRSRSCFHRSLRQFALAVALVLVTCGVPGLAVAQNCPGDGDCLEPNDTPGCADPGCCEAVCGLDPFCCEDWDLTCATMADVTCVGLCGAQASGSCFAANGSPGCNDRTCCEAVCLGDPYCCQGAWDSSCALFAGFFCEVPGGECGDADAGDCFEANGTPACNDTTCCDVVCGIDPTCCDLNWDAICAAIAADACMGACVVGTAPGDQIEGEGCDGPSNDACDGGMADMLDPDRAIHGTFKDAADRDVVLVDATALDRDGDGQVRLRFQATASAARFSIRENDCEGDLILQIDVAACITGETIACVPATVLAVIIEPTGEVPPCDEPGWRFDTEFADTCGTTCGNTFACLAPHETPGCADAACCELVCAQDPLCCDWVWDSPCTVLAAELCGNAFACLAPHEAPGCADAACCELVCAQDPLCCDWAWDSPCTVLAAELCGGDPPANDTCAAAMPIGNGATPFRQLLSTVTAPEGDCIDPALRGGDVWFRHVANCDSVLRLGTCGTADFNTLVEVFQGDCRSLTPVECIDDEEFCSFETGSVLLDVTCGETYLIRVSGVDGATGSGEIFVECFGATCPCREDLDGNGRVDGADLGRLFIEWGPCKAGCVADLDDDGQVAGSDLGLLFAAWGDC